MTRSHSSRNCLQQVPGLAARNEAKERACRGAARARHDRFHTSGLPPPGSSQPPSEPSLCLHMHMQGCQIFNLPHPSYKVPET